MNVTFRAMRDPILRARPNWWIDGLIGCTASLRGAGSQMALRHAKLQAGSEIGRSLRNVEPSAGKPDRRLSLRIKTSEASKCA
jgi:hypothetical protein